MSAARKNAYLNAFLENENADLSEETDSEDDVDWIPDDNSSSCSSSDDCEATDNSGNLLFSLGELYKTFFIEILNEQYYFYR